MNLPGGRNDPGGTGERPTEPLVSVIVIGYNQRQFAPQAVASVLAQSYRNLECIFVDDGSSDGTFEAVAALAPDEPRLKLFAKDNGGPSSARNFGASHASPMAEFIAFLDGDDRMCAAYLNATLRYMSAHYDAGLIIPNNEFIDATGSRVRHPVQRRWIPGILGCLPSALPNSTPRTPFVTFYCGTGGRPFWIARRHLYEATSGWNEAFWRFEDYEILCQFALLTEVHFIPEKLVEYRVHNSQLTRQSGSIAEKQSSGALERMQERFNSRKYENENTARIVDDACRYYRRVHLPLRHARVATKHLIEAIRKGSPARLASAAVLYGHFFRDFVQFRVLFWRARRTYSLLKH